MVPSITKISIFFGVFSLMALSNAIIPILPGLGGTISVQSYIFSAYFFGAMVATLPGGMISEKIGQFPLVFAGLVLTLLTGTLLVVLDQPVLLLAVRLVEGIGSGLFVSASLSWINQQSDHGSLSGYFMALLNMGLLTGLLVAGWLAGIWDYSKGGVFVFVIVTVFPLIIVAFHLLRGDTGLQGEKSPDSEEHLPDWTTLFREVYEMGLRQSPLWFSVIVLLGITGFVQAVYPDLSDLAALDIGIALAVMNLATVIASLIAPRIRVEPVFLIRISSIIMGVLVLVFIRYPISVFIMGFVAGLIMISQINYLALSEERQGIAMGLFSTSSYAGMTILPAIGGTIIGFSSLNFSAWCIALLAVICALFIGRCKCRGFQLPEP